MLIKQLTTYAGPLGLHPAGTVWDAPQAEALALIDGNYAVQIESAPAESGEFETTDAVREIETTANKPGGKRK